MADKPLPLIRLPRDGELFLSFVGRNAADHDTTIAALLAHGLSASHDEEITPDMVTIRLRHPELSRLSHLFRRSEDQLQSQTLKHSFPALDHQDISFLGAARDMCTGKDVSNGRLRIGWCPLCLLEDRAEGGDHYLRLEWSLASITMCHQHNRPLIERCQHCYCFVHNAEFARYRDQLALICPHCLTPLDAGQGHDFVSNYEALKWQRDVNQSGVWRRLIIYENIFLKTLRMRCSESKPQRLCQELKAVLDIVVRANGPNTRRPLDLLSSYRFPAPAKLSMATRDLQHPFHFCCLAERRKAMAILAALIEDSADDFGFASPECVLREIMPVARQDSFHRHMLNIAKLAIPRQ